MANIELRGSGVMDQALAELFIKLRDEGYKDFTMKYFPEGHVSKLIEGALGVQGHHLVLAKLDLGTL